MLIAAQKRKLENAINSMLPELGGRNSSRRDVYNNGDAIDSRDTSKRKIFGLECLQQQNHRQQLVQHQQQQRQQEHHVQS
jgi:hypothetical protein